MRYINRIPPADKVLGNELISQGWKKLKEPSNLGIAILLSTPFMFINGAISMVIAFFLYPPVKELLFSEQGFSLSFSVNIYSIIYVLIIFIFMAVHEFIHACFIPNGLRSDKTYWGINGLFGFIFTSEKIKKGRFLIISIMPFIILSVIISFGRLWPFFVKQPINLMRR